MQIQNPDEFYKDLIWSISNAQSNIYICSMNFETGNYVDNLVDALLAALSRGVKVQLNIDWIYQHFTHGDVPIFIRLNKLAIAKNKQIVCKTNRLLNRLRQAGANVEINNKPHFPLHLIKIFGRDHKKIYSIDNKKLWIGGVNLFDEAFENVDLMLKITDTAIIKKLFQMIENRNEIAEIESGQIIIDNGKVNTSRIYEILNHQIDKAKYSIMFVSQFLPDNYILNKLIAKSKIGLDVTIHTSMRSDRKFVEFPGSLLYKFAINKIHDSKLTLLHNQFRIHAKTAIFDDATFILGSHNLTNYGVLLATEEIALCIKNRAVVQQIKKQLNFDH